MKLELPTKILDLESIHLNYTCIYFLSKYIYGVQSYLLLRFFRKIGLPQNYKFRFIKKNMLLQLVEYINDVKFCFVGHSIILKSFVHLQSIGIYRSIRHKLGYPSRGQRTRSNASSAKFMRSLMVNVDRIQQRIQDSKNKKKNLYHK